MHLDETYISSGFSQVNLTGLKHINLGAPRTYGISARYRFDNSHQPHA